MTFFKKLFWDLNLKYYDVQKSLCELKSVGIEITGRCNLQCRHCYMESKLESAAQELSAEEWMEFFDDLKRDFGNQINIQLTGGEPLVKDGIFEILIHLKQLGFRTTMATNGTLLTVERINEFKKYVSAVSISLDGFEKSHNYLRGADVFTQTVENIKNAKSAGVDNVTIKTTVYRNNLGELRDFYVFLQETGIGIWHLFAMEPCGRGKLNRGEIISFAEYKELCEFVDEVKSDKRRKMRIIFEEQPTSFMNEKTFDCNKYKLCRAGISSCAILPGGDVVNCVQGNRDIVYGNIKNGGFKDIWNKGFRENRSKEYTSCQKHHFNNN